MDINSVLDFILIYLVIVGEHSMQVYKYDEHYTRDIGEIKERIHTLMQRGHSPHLIALYRGSLPMTTHLSNIIPCDMSIIDFQSYDVTDGVVKEPKWILNKTREFDTLIVLDDIFDSGRTIEKVRAFLKEERPDSYVECHVLVGGKTAAAAEVFYYTEHTGDWVVFPWEMDYEENNNKEQ